MRGGACCCSLFSAGRRTEAFLLARMVCFCGSAASLLRAPVFPGGERCVDGLDGLVAPCVGGESSGDKDSKSKRASFSTRTQVSVHRMSSGGRLPPSALVPLLVFWNLEPNPAVSLHTQNLQLPPDALTRSHGVLVSKAVKCTSASRAAQTSVLVGNVCQRSFRCLYRSFMY